MCYAGNFAMNTNMAFNYLLMAQKIAEKCLSVAFDSGKQLDTSCRKTRDEFAYLTRLFNTINSAFACTDARLPRLQLSI